MTESLTFGYPCQEQCQELRGTVRAHVIPNYSTRVHGVPFVVERAVIGICDRCGAEHFAASEVKRWAKLFEEEHRSKTEIPF